MVRKSLLIMIAGLAVCGLLFTVSCANKEVKSETGSMDTGTGSGMDDEGQWQPGTSGRGASAEDMEEEAIRMEMQRAQDNFVNEDVYFDFDQSVLTPAAQGVLERKAAWLRRNPDVSVIIEGHCDERGTVEYNIALGERRARSAKNFLVDLGISSSRLRTISYGEERPLDPRHNEAAWAKNRRVHFVIR